MFALGFHGKFPLTVYSVCIKGGNFAGNFSLSSSLVVVCQTSGVFFFFGSSYDHSFFFVIVCFKVRWIISCDCDVASESTSKQIAM